MKQVITKVGEVLQMNDNETEVFHFGTWKEIQTDQEGEFYFMGGLQAIYFDYLTPVQTTNNQDAAVKWWYGLTESEQIQLIKKYYPTRDISETGSGEMKRMYLSENPTPTMQEEKVTGIICNFCNEVNKVDDVYFLEGREDGKTVICNKCENKLSIVFPQEEKEGFTGGQSVEYFKQKWGNSCAELGEVVKDWAILKSENQRLQSLNDTLANLLKAYMNMVGNTGYSIAKEQAAFLFEKTKETLQSI